MTDSLTLGESVKLSLALMEKSYVLHVFAFLFGASLGSFVNVVIYRLPADESLLYPGSHCPACGSPIKWYDNLPIISYLWLRGHCRFCGGRISIQYPAVELLVAAISVVLLTRYHATPAYLVYLCFAAALVAASVTDIYYRMIPDAICIAGIPAGILISLFPGVTVNWLDSLLGAGAGFFLLFLVSVIYKAAAGREGLGLGDAFLLSMMGAFQGWQSIPVILFVGSLVGLIAGLVMIVGLGQSRTYRIPFGPFLSVGAMAAMFIGPVNINFLRHVGLQNLGF